MNRHQEVKVNSIRNVANVCVASCRKLTARIERARENLRAEFRESFQLPEQLFRQALGEAEALAWQTGYPQLVFPALAAEKVQAVAAWHRRQQSLVSDRPRAGLAA